MIDFNLEIKTKLYFGKGKENEIADIISSYGFSRVLIVIGTGSVKTSGLYDKVINLLKQKNIVYQTLEGVRANPTIESVYEGLKIAKELKPEIVLAIGGGSVMDAAKSIACGYYYDGDPFDFNRHLASPTKALPVGCIVTLAASGSEMSTSCVIQDDKSKFKAGFNSEWNRPLFAIENPELTYSVNKEQTVNGIIDIIMHTLERYFSSSDENELCDRFAEGLMKTVIQAGYKAIDNPYDYEARADLLLASSLSHCGITSIGKKYSMPVHALGHPVSGAFPFIAHGTGLAILLPHWMKYYYSYQLNKFDSFARNVFDSYLSNKEENALNGINKLQEFFKNIGALRSFKEISLDIDPKLLANLLTNNRSKTIPNFGKEIDYDVALEIYTKAYEGE